jgi:hypothetical protein
VVDKFLLNLDFCLRRVVRKVYMRSESHATGLTNPHKQRSVGRFYNSHSACCDDTPRFLENVPLTDVQGELEPQILAGGFRVL